MSYDEKVMVESPTLHDFAEIMQAGDAPHTQACLEEGVMEPAKWSSGRLDINPDNVKNGLGRLVLTVMKLLHELLERQAIQRIEGGSLSDEQVEDLGNTFMHQAQEIERLRKAFGLEEDDLNMDLGPLGKLL